MSKGICPPDEKLFTYFDNLIDEDDFNNYCQDFGINTTTRIILKYMSDIKNTNK
jgi:Ca2+-binding EF-hand superfamily protein